eukprot:g1408.t1
MAEKISSSISVIFPRTVNGIEWDVNAKNEIEVAWVIEASIADVLGVEINDVLVGINGKSCVNFSLGKLRKELNRTKKKTKLTFRRDNDDSGAEEVYHKGNKEVYNFLDEISKLESHRDDVRTAIVHAKRDQQVLQHQKNQGIDPKETGKFTVSFGVGSIGIVLEANDENEVQVSEVLPASAAFREGVQVYDILCSIQGVNCEGLNIQEINRLIQNCSPPKTFIFRHHGKIDHDAWKREIDHLMKYESEINEELRELRERAYKLSKGKKNDSSDATINADEETRKIEEEESKIEKKRIEIKGRLGNAIGAWQHIFSEMSSKKDPAELLEHQRELEKWLEQQSKDVEELELDVNDLEDEQEDTEKRIEELYDEIDDAEDEGKEDEYIEKIDREIEDLQQNLVEIAEDLRDAKGTWNDAADELQFIESTVRHICNKDKEKEKRDAKRKAKMKAEAMMKEKLYQVKKKAIDVANKAASAAALAAFLAEESVANAEEKIKTKRLLESVKHVENGLKHSSRLFVKEMKVKVNPTFHYVVSGNNTFMYQDKDGRQVSVPKLADFLSTKTRAMVINEGEEKMNMSHCDFIKVLSNREMIIPRKYETDTSADANSTLVNLRSKKYRHSRLWYASIQDQNVTENKTMKGTLKELEERFVEIANIIEEKKKRIPSFTDQ